VDAMGTLLGVSVRRVATGYGRARGGRHVQSVVSGV
jgi:hypothetical protein